MRMLKYAVLTGALACLNIVPAYTYTTRSTPQNCSTSYAPPGIQNDVFEAFLEKFYIEKNTTDAILENMSENYIQHNPYALSGRQNAIDYVGSIFQTANFTIAHQGFINNLGWVHTKMEIPDTPFTALVDIYRFEGTCIVEHWDVATQLPANATNPLALF